MIDFQKVGMNIATLRHKKQMTQDELASKLFVTRQAISKWENGTSMLSIDTVIELSKIFDVTIERLLLLDTDKSQSAQASKDIFLNQNRTYVLDQIIRQAIYVDIPSIFDQLYHEERMLVLKKIKQGTLPCDLKELRLKLTTGEQKYLFNQIFHIGGK